MVSVAGAGASVAGAVLSVDSDSPPPQAVKANPAISILMATRIVLVDLNIGDCFVWNKIGDLSNMSTKPAGSMG